MFFDGLSKTTAPGSLWDPAETHLAVASMGKLGVSFGLLMAGFSGHAVIPSLARDMLNPQEFDRMINWAFFISTVIYAIIAAVGYLMFGQSVSDEVSRDLLHTPGYNPGLNHFALWLLVVSPVSKFALATRPLNIALETMLGIDNKITHQTATNSMAMKQPVPTPDTRATLKKVGLVVERSLFTLLSVGVSILIPEFSSMMAFLGAFSAFVLCVIGPILAKVSLAGWKIDVRDAALILISTVMAAWGTGAVFVV